MKKILVVEDETIILRLATNILITTGCEIIIAKNGVEGLKKFLKEKPDLVLTDLEMSLMSGLELAHKIRKTNPGQKIIIMSGNTDLDELKVPEGVVKVSKPFDIEKLLETVKQILF